MDGGGWRWMEVDGGGTNFLFSGIAAATTGSRSGSSTNTAYNQAALKVYPLHIPSHAHLPFSSCHHISNY